MHRIKQVNFAMVFTLSRFFLGACGIVLLTLGYQWYGFTVLLVAFLTDFLDGQVARRTRRVTDLGAMLDPIADKLLVSEIFIYMMATGIMPLIPAILIIIFEFSLIGLAIYVRSKGKVDHSIWVGKIKFQTQWLCLLFYFFGLETIGFGMLLLALVMTWCSLLSHIILAQTALKGT